MKKIKDVMATVIGFASQKGGCGKSTLTILAASYLAYVRKRRVAVIDGDKQGSIDEMRTLDIKKNPGYMEGLRKSGVEKPFDIYYCLKYEDLAKFIKKVSSMQYDIVIVDFPGQMSDSQVLVGISQCDKVVIPAQHTEMAFMSTIRGYKTIRDFMQVLDKNGMVYPLKEIAIVMTMIPSTQRSLANSLKTNGLPQLRFDYIFNTMIGRVDNFKQDRLSTVGAPGDDTVKVADGGHQFGSFLDELARWIGLED